MQTASNRAVAGDEAGAADRSVVDPTGDRSAGVVP